MPHWQTTRFHLELSRPLVMGIVNVTPDSFSDGGRHAELSQALRHCEQLLDEGADILDIGGESTRPGAAAASLEEELARVLPLLKEAGRLGVPLSIDTYKPEVMQAALDVGVDIVNDIQALRLPGALEVVARHGQCGACLMHMQGEPRSMQASPGYGDVVDEVRGFLAERLARARAPGQVLRRRGSNPHRRARRGFSGRRINQLRAQLLDARLVPAAGLEPAPSCEERLLRPPRQPVAPHRHGAPSCLLRPP